MNVRKIFFPMGEGEDIESRIYGALTVAKFFKAYIEVLICQLNPSVVYNMKMTLRGGVLFDEFLKSAKDELKNQEQENKELFIKICKELDIEFCNNLLKDKTSANLVFKDGKRSKIVEIDSKFCDLVVAAIPLNGRITGTFESVIAKSGKSVLAIPRQLKKFNPEKILISWSANTQSSRAITNSLDLLKQAKKVHCITSKASLGDDASIHLKELENYLSIHGVASSFEVINTTLIPGEALLKFAKNGNYDLIVASRHGEHGLKEMFLGGTSKFFLERTDIPVFM